MGNNCAIVSQSGYIWIWSGARDQESTNNSAHFVEWKSSCITKFDIYTAPTFGSLFCLYLSLLCGKLVTYINRILILCVMHLLCLKWEKYKCFFKHSRVMITWEYQSLLPTKFETNRASYMKLGNSTLVVLWFVHRAQHFWLNEFQMFVSCYHPGEASPCLTRTCWLIFWQPTGSWP